MKKPLARIHWLLASQFGLDPRRLLRSLRGLPGFVVDMRRFRRGYAGPLSFAPCLHDRYEEGGSTKSEYFWQDLLVARWIFAASPKRHVDIGSRVDGFVAHVASFREIEVFDVRPIHAAIPGIVFRQADLMRLGDALPATQGGYCDSLSCLHALEHFGLGRYGDPVDPVGHERGLANMASLLQPGGTFYLSAPIGRERVEFNAHRIFDPQTVIRLAESNALSLRQLTIVRADAAVEEVPPTHTALRALAQQSYSLGIFVFTKTS